MEKRKKPLLVIMDADELEKASDLLENTKRLRACYDVECLFSDSGKEKNFNLKVD